MNDKCLRDALGMCKTCPYGLTPFINFKGANELVRKDGVERFFNEGHGCHGDHDFRAGNVGTCRGYTLLLSGQHPMYPTIKDFVKLFIGKIELHNAQCPKPISQT